MKLSNLPKNIMIVLGELIKNQKICKLLKYHSKSNPYLEPDIEKPSSLIKNEILPYPFDRSINTSEKMELRVYYDSFRIGRGKVVEDSYMVFDVIYSKSDNVYLMNDGEMKFKPLELVSLIIEQLSNDIPYFGSLHFSERIRNVYVNDKFDCYQIIAKVFSTSE